MKLVVLLSLLVVTPQVYGQVSDCLLSNSDPDGDGWGYEDNKSCRVRATNNPVTPGPSASCIDTAPVGDGWGWNGTSSCRVGQQQDPILDDPTQDDPVNPICQFPGISDPDNDGFGWENGGTCTVGEIPQNSETPNPWAQLIKGNWHCQSRFPWLGGYQLVASEFSTYTNISSWETYPQTCVRGCGTYGSYNIMTFNDSQVAIERFQSHQPGENTWLGTESVEWSINDFTFTIDGEAQQKMAFENHQGNHYFHYYQDDSNRITCKKL